MKKILYECDPEKNTACRKRMCVFLTGFKNGCHRTKNIEYARTNKDGLPTAVWTWGREEEDMITRNKDRQVRAVTTKFNTREEENGLHIEGYFAVFDVVYEIWPGATESVDRHAFDNSLGGDIRALTNHDTTLVLGRTKAHTLELRVDEHGLWGDITINPNDQDAMNLYERVKRGDVDQCSFGFNIISEETEFRDDGSVHWTITEVELFEVSVCTFPAYEQTNVSAREAQREALSKNRLEDWKQSARARIHKEG